MNDDHIARLHKRIERERLARQQAEEMLESKSLELYRANLSLRQLADDLESQVERRTRELERALDDAQAATRAKSQFLATMSHEIRTPLFGVIGTAELLERSRLDAQQTEQIGVIRSSGESLLALLNEILEFSKLDAERLELQSIEFDLEAEGQAAAQLFRPMAAAHGLSLSVSVDTQERLVRGDPLRLRQIVSNLLSNAVKFTTEGGIELVISTEPSDGRIAVTVSVRDTGPGIPEHERELLFEEFRQGDPSTTRVHGGTGLGLAIVSRLAQLMGGGVTLESRVGVGSVFTVTIVLDLGSPRVDTQPPVKSSPEFLRPGSQVSDLRILLAEDNPINRVVATAMLEKVGCRLEIAEDGGEAVDRVATGVFDVVLMDLQMPVIDGLEATRRIRRLDLAKQPYIVALTANAFDSDRQRCMEAGMDDFLAKPFSLAEISSLCERIEATSSLASG